MPPTATDTEDETETQDQSSADTQTGDEDEEGAAGDDSDDESESSGTDGQNDVTDGDDSAEGEEEDRLAAAVEAARVAALEEGRTLGRQEAVDERRTQNREQTIEEVKNLFPSAMRDARNAASKITFEVDGQQVTLTAEQVNTILAPFEAHNLKSWQANERLVLGAISDTIYGDLPKSEHDAFTAAVDGKQLHEWMGEFAERKAFSTKAFKELASVDDLEKVAGTKLKADLARVKAAEFEAGRKKGRNDPPGEPRTDGRASPSKSWESLRAGYGNGTLTPAEEREYYRQRDERAKAS